MRLTAAVVVGMLLVSSNRIALAEESSPAEPARGGSNRLSSFLCKWNPLCRPPGPPRNCSDACDASYDTCIASWDGKRSVSCAGEAVRCKRACPPEAVTTHTINRTPANCMDLCTVEFGDCTKRPQDSRKPDECATETVKCRNACKEMQLAAARVATAPPPVATAPPPVAAAPAPAEERVAAPAPAAEHAAKHAPAAVEKPAERHEPVLSRAMAKDPKTAPAPPPAPAPAPAAAPAPPPAPPAVVTDTSKRAQNVEAPPAAPAAAAGTTGVAPSAAVVASGTATATKTERPGFFARMRCYLSPSCRGGPEPTTPRTCVEQCQADYDRCVGPDESLPGSECATWMMRCRQKCRQDSAAKAP